MFYGKQSTMYFKINIEYTNTQWRQHVVLSLAVHTVTTRL
jgi:hypothetical protein